MTATPHLLLLEAVADRARDADVFETVELTDGLLRCHARHVEEDAWYQVGPLQTVDETSKMWVGLYTPDRWLSESVEADVLHQGDKFEELLEEEMVDQGLEAGDLPTVEHFRDDEKVFVFRTPVPLPNDPTLSDPKLVDRLTKQLLAYEACFRELGDMTPDEDEL